MLLNKQWTFYKIGDEANKKIVNLPYDAMLRENRSIKAKGGDKVGFFEGGDYMYEKIFNIVSLENREIYFEFEGIYHDAEITINGKNAYKQEYGYSDFVFNATRFLKGGLNSIKVKCTNSDQPNSRWYSGAGIYRNVHIYTLPSTHILPRSLKVKTLDYKTGKIEVSALLNRESATRLDIFDQDNQFVCSYNLAKTAKPVYTIEIANFQLWDVDDPNLYRAVLTCGTQKEEVFFGIRHVELDKNKGLLLNGKRTILYGCCVHSDNGLMGAESYESLEFKKAKKIKSAGYNAVRCAHNPASRDFLIACDIIGLMVIDEYVDMWYIHKTAYDYAPRVKTNYEKDLFDMVEKDYSHPCVIAYSIGNEVSETAFDDGIKLAEDMTTYLHNLDNTRPVTCGINMVINGFSKGLFKYYSNEKAIKNSNKPNKKKSGSDLFNNFVSKHGQSLMKFLAKLRRVDKNTKKVFARLDIAGYNYGISRYKKDLKKYPSRYILGTETFCSDASEFYTLAQKNPRIIGDFVWAGVDYLGEAGFNSWVNGKECNYKKDRSGWLTNGGGRLDILLNESFEVDITRCAFRQQEIALGVVSPYDLASPKSPSMWKCSRALRSYSFPGYENKNIEVEVYSYHPHIKVLLNDKKVAEFNNTKGKNHFRFKMKYIPGKLVAESYDSKKQKRGLAILTTNNNAHFSISSDEKIGYADELFPIHFNIVNDNNEIMPIKKEEVEIVSVTNGSLERFGNACPYNKEGYLQKKATTYYGTCTAIIRPRKEGTTSVLVRTKNEGLTMINIPVQDRSKYKYEREYGY